MNEEEDFMRALEEAERVCNPAEFYHRQHELIMALARYMKVKITNMGEDCGQADKQGEEEREDSDGGIEV